MRVAIIHDWLVTYAGSERVLIELLKLFPHADLFCLVDFLPGHLRQFFGNREIHTSFIQKLPWADRYYRNYLPLMPVAVEQFDLRGYELVISSSHAVAKGVIARPDALHISYIHSPPRYAWDLQEGYLRNFRSSVKNVLARLLLHYLRLWDSAAGQRPDLLVANSNYTARRIQKSYRRDATVIFPPVDVNNFALCTERDDFYLTVGRMVPYKRIDLVVEAFSRMQGRKLVVIGDGPDMPRISRIRAPNVRLLGHQPNDILRSYMQRARAFVFAAEEDFGIAPVEAQACGTPVIAFGRGGVAETVIPEETGIFFYEQTVESIINAVERFDRLSFDPLYIRQNAQRFSAERFRQEFLSLVRREWEKFTGRSFDQDSSL